MQCTNQAESPLFCYSYDAAYIMQLSAIVDFFKNVASKDITIPDRRAYQERPSLFYEHAEQNRHLINNPEIQGEVQELLKMNERPGLLAELNLRITKMCEIEYKDL